MNTTARTDLGRNEFHGVCATCHGMEGQGGYGPNLSHNPILTQQAALETSYAEDAATCRPSATRGRPSR